MSKVACNQCGAMILPRTAAETGGICMACKQGIRASMEASRDRCKERKPIDELWQRLVRDADADPSLSAWPQAARSYFSVRLLCGEVYNGGFEQFFWNSSGAYFADAVTGLKTLEAENVLDILQDAASLFFGSAPPPTDQQERWDAMRPSLGFPGQRSEAGEAATKLEALDRLFSADPDNLDERLTAFAQQSGIITPFGKEA